jgi:hypothetical protein
MRFKAFFLGRKKATGSVAVANLVDGFKDILSDLANSLAENDYEIKTASDEVLYAEARRDNLQQISTDGDRLLQGLKKLL